MQVVDRADQPRPCEMNEHDRGSAEHPWDEHRKPLSPILIREPKQLPKSLQRAGEREPDEQTRCSRRQRTTMLRPGPLQLTVPNPHQSRQGQAGFRRHPTHLSVFQHQREHVRYQEPIAVPRHGLANEPILLRLRCAW